MTFKQLVIKKMERKLKKKLVLYLDPYCNFLIFDFQRLELATARPSLSAPPTKSGDGPCASPRSGSVTEIQIVLMAQMKTGKLDLLINIKNHLYYEL